MKATVIGDQVAAELPMLVALDQHTVTIARVGVVTVAVDCRCGWGETRLTLERARRAGADHVAELVAFETHCAQARALHDDTTRCVPSVVTDGFGRFWAECKACGYESAVHEDDTDYSNEQAAIADAFAHEDAERPSLSVVR